MNQYTELPHNSHAWHLVDPDGKHYFFYNLSAWALENCNLFGFEKTNANALKVARGIIRAKGVTLGKSHAMASMYYKGWEVIISEKCISDFKKYKKCDLSILGQTERLYMKLLMDGIDYKYIAQYCGVKEQTVRCLVSRAKSNFDGMADGLKEKNREYYKMRRDKIAEINKKSYQKNRDKRIANMKVYNKEYYRRNRERILANSKARRQSQNETSPES